MSLTDFLFNGSPPPQVTSYQSTSASVPDWYSSYAQGILAKGNAVAAVPASDYFANRPPQVAPFSADQTAAFDQTRQNNGSTQPMFNTANGLINQAGSANSLGMAQPYMNQAGSANISGAAQPAIGQAMGYNPYDAGSGYLGQAAQTWGQSAANQYMSPYMSNVTDEIARLGGRNLTENLLPGVNDTFTGAGQFGSSRHADFTGRAVRDANDSILGAQSQALQQGYGQAQNAFNTDQSRLGSLGTAAGNLAQSTQAGLTNIGQLQGQLAGSQAANQLAVGSGLGNLGIAQSASQLAAGQGLGNLATQQQGNQLRDSAALEAVGQTQQGQTQQNLNSAYQNWLDERDYNKNNTSWLNSTLQGIQVPTSSSQTYTGPGNAYQPSPLAQIAQGVGTYGALKNVI